MVASSEKLCQKWATLLPMATVTLESGSEWPHGVATSGDEVFEMFGRLGRTPTWVIVDGGALHHSTVLMFKDRNLKKWGVRGAVSVWGQKLDESEALLRHGTLEGLGVALDRVMQRGVAKGLIDRSGRAGLKKVLLRTIFGKIGSRQRCARFPCRRGEKKMITARGCSRGSGSGLTNPDQGKGGTVWRRTTVD